MTLETATAFLDAVKTPTRARWEAVADTLRAEATATPTTRDQRDAENVGQYCAYRLRSTP